MKTNMTINSMSLLAIFIAFIISSCATTPQNGQILCREKNDCPNGMVCHYEDGDADGRCYYAYYLGDGDMDTDSDRENDNETDTASDMNSNANDLDIPQWQVLVLIYTQTEVTYADENGDEIHVQTQMNENRAADAAEYSRHFFENDLPVLSSGLQHPELTLRYPDHPLSHLIEINGDRAPTPESVAVDIDAPFDSVIVFFDDTGVNVETQEPIDLMPYADAASHGERDDDWTFSILSFNDEYDESFYSKVLTWIYADSLIRYFSATGMADLTSIAYKYDAFVNCKTNKPYDESNDGPNSIYHLKSGYYHDLLSGQLALRAVPGRCIGITSDIWKTGGPATKQPNLLSNEIGGFENLEAWEEWHWGTPVYQLDTDTPLKGETSLRFDCPKPDIELSDTEGTNGCDIWFAHTVSLKPKTEYLLEAYVKTENVECQSDRDGASVSANMADNERQYFTTQIKGANDWGKVQVSFNSETYTQTEIKVRLGMHGSTCYGAALFDDIRLTVNEIE